MESPTLDSIKNRLELISKEHYKDIDQYLDFLTFQENSGFTLSPNQLKLLQHGSHIPNSDCKPAKQLIHEMREKYIK